MVIGLKRYYNDLTNGNYLTGSGLLARKTAAMETETSKVLTGAKSRDYKERQVDRKKRKAIRL